MQDFLTQSRVNTWHYEVNRHKSWDAIFKFPTPQSSRQSLNQTAFPSSSKVCNFIYFYFFKFKLIYIVGAFSILTTAFFYEIKTAFYIYKE